MKEAEKEVLPRIWECRIALSCGPPHVELTLNTAHVRKADGGGNQVLECSFYSLLFGESVYMKELGKRGMADLIKILYMPRVRSRRQPVDRDRARGSRLEDTIEARTSQRFCNGDIAGLRREASQAARRRCLRYDRSSVDSGD